MTEKTRIEVRPARRSDLIAICGENSPLTVRAWAMDVNGEPAAVAGFFMAGGRAVVFSDIAKEGIPKLAIWRAAKKFMEKLTCPAACVAKEGSQEFLERLGWVYNGTDETGDVYTW
ncbi:MAG: hypothetical protein R3186_05015, partial [Ruegeria sp.]|nr:hypothetical protein [Ruegeria sp.]